MDGTVFFFITSVAITSEAMAPERHGIGRVGDSPPREYRGWLRALGPFGGRALISLP